MLRARLASAGDLVQSQAGLVVALSTSGILVQMRMWTQEAEVAQIVRRSYCCRIPGRLSVLPHLLMTKSWKRRWTLPLAPPPAELASREMCSKESVDAWESPRGGGVVSGVRS